MTSTIVPNTNTANVVLRVLRVLFRSSPRVCLPGFCSVAPRPAAIAVRSTRAVLAPPICMVAYKGSRIPAMLLMVCFTLPASRKAAAMPPGPSAFRRSSGCCRLERILAIRPTTSNVVDVRKSASSTWALLAAVCNGSFSTRASVSVVGSFRAALG